MASETQATLRCMSIASFVGFLAYTNHLTNEYLIVGSLVALAIPAVADVFLKHFGKGK